MDKTAIRNFAIEARKILMKSAITEAGFYGVTKNGCKSPMQKGPDFEVYETLAGTENRIFGDDIKRRSNLVRAIEEQGFDQVIEETAYTWFNRIIAIRFMEVNNYLPTRVRVLSSEAGGGTPDIVTQADTVELNLTTEELDKIRDAKKDNRYDDAFRLLFIKQCNELNAILPGLFERTDDYMELLLKISYTSDGVIRMLVDSIPESNFNVETEGQVEIIGWMYQYYNTELKDDTFAKLKKNVKITKERIPAATQLFTPDWIVRYMVENSLGRVWIEHLRAVDPSVDEKLKAEEFGWKYYLPEAEQEEDVAAQLVEIRKSYKDLTPQDITCIDPCMGSGHILVYMFDVLMDIYRSEGFSEREAVFDILEKNIRGLDIDRRAYQLSYFALMMKARGYNRIFFRGHEDYDGNRIQAVPKVYAIEESNSIERDKLEYFGANLDDIQKNNAINQMNGLLDVLKDAKEYGSILSVDNYDWNLLRSFVDRVDDSGQMSLISFAAGQSQPLLKKLIDIGESLATKYDIVVTNPPYMGSSGMGEKLCSYLKNNYKHSKSDMFAVFIERCDALTNIIGITALITQHSWMFINSYEALRSDLYNRQFVGLLHLGIKAFEEIGNDVVQTCSFVFKKKKIDDYKTKFVRLVDSRNYKQKEIDYLNGINQFSSKCQDFYDIPGLPMAYWVSRCFIENFKKGKFIEDYGTLTGSQNITGDNERYLRLFWEVEKNSVGDKWRFYAKGGDYRQYFGNLSFVVDWSENARKFYSSNKTSNLLSEEYWFKPGITYSAITSRGTGFRYLPEGCIFDKGGPSIILHKNVEEILALLNSNVAKYYFWVFNPSINLQVKDVKSFPIILSYNEECVRMAYENIALCKKDWDSFESSWDFKQHPLANNDSRYLRISERYNEWKKERETDFNTLLNNEKALNRIFIELYGLTNDLSDNVEERDVTVRRADLLNDMRGFVSYAVGCMFGRYSLDESGIICAGKEFDANRYEIFPADKDAIIPITDEPYFDDDIVSRFEKFVECLYGKEEIDNNLEFIADALNIKGNSVRERLRYYFINDFYKDHCNVYSVTGSGKRPIYWLFDSGKQNGFKCLIYLHRYTPDTVGLIRSDYLMKTQNMIENALENSEYIINTSSSAVDRAQATKKRDKYIKQLAEIRAYYPALSHIALQRIDLDLDDGVKVNYEKFQGIEVSVEGEKKQKIDLLAKI